MGDKTGIQWTDATWNPVTGCSKISAGCKNCYAERVFPRAYKGREFTDVRCHPERLDQPLRWKRQRRVFVNSMSDLFHESVPSEFLTATFGVMSASMQHTFQVLTKRPQRMHEWFDSLTASGGLCRYIRSMRVDGDRTLPDLFSAVARTEVVAGQKRRAIDDSWMQVFNAAACVSDPLPNVWLGVSVEDQATADERIPLLLQTPAAVRFLSVEPLLEPIDLTKWLPAAENLTLSDVKLIGLIDWVIVGGESGPRARPCNIEWVRSVVAQCKAAGVPCFVKQLGAVALDSGYPLELRDSKGGDSREWPEDLRVREFPE